MTERPKLSNTTTGQYVKYFSKIIIFRLKGTVQQVNTKPANYIKPQKNPIILINSAAAGVELPMVLWIQSQNVSLVIHKSLLKCRQFQSLGGGNS